VDSHASVRFERARSERERRDVTFADCPKTENKAQVAFWRSVLIGVGHDARVEQGCRLERIFVEKIGTDKLPLSQCINRTVCERSTHLARTDGELVEKIAVPSLEIFQNLGELAAHVRRTQG